MAILGWDRKELNYKEEQGTNALRQFVESTIISESTDVDRITRYNLYWQFYKGKHWRMYNETMLSFNYIKAFIDKVNSFLLGKNAFTFKVERFDNLEVTEELETAFESFIDFHWKRSKKTFLAQEMFQMGSVCGDLWVHMQWNDTLRYCHIEVIDSRHSFPVFRNGNVNDLESFVIRQPLVDNKDGYRVYAIEYREDEIKTWFQKSTSLKAEREQVEVSKNTYGFIPIVHIKNRPTSDEYYAKSDVADILKINKVYNELAQEIKNIIDYYGTPTTIITGGTAKTLKKGLGNIWSGLPPEASVFNLGLGEDLNGTLQFMQMLKTSMHELTDVPESSLGRLQAISNTSAAALQVTYQPLIQQADIKWITYGEGIAEINEKIIQMVRAMYPSDERLRALPKDAELDYRVLPVFTYGLPQDRSVELNQANMELAMKIASRREIMNRLGKTNVPALLKQIDEDLVYQQQLLTLQPGQPIPEDPTISAITKDNIPINTNNQEPLG